MGRQGGTPELQLKGGIIKVCKARGVSDGSLDLEGGALCHSPLKQHLWLCLQQQTQKMRQKNMEVGQQAIDIPDLLAACRGAKQ